MFQFGKTILLMLIYYLKNLWIVNTILQNSRNATLTLQMVKCGENNLVRINRNANQVIAFFTTKTAMHSWSSYTISLCLQIWLFKTFLLFKIKKKTTNQSKRKEGNAAKAKGIYTGGAKNKKTSTILCKNVVSQWDELTSCNSNACNCNKLLPGARPRNTASLLLPFVSHFMNCILPASECRKAE